MLLAMPRLTPTATTVRTELHLGRSSRGGKGWAGGLELSGGSEVDTAQVYIRRDEIAASGGPARRRTNDEAGLDEVTESREQKRAPGFRRRSNSYVTRAAFV